MNLQKMMKQAQEMQNKLAAAQKQVGEETREGKAGGGKVTVTLSGSGELRSVSLDKSVVDPEDVETLEDLILVAFKDAKDQVDAFAEEQMKKATSGLGLPPGMKLPF